MPPDRNSHHYKIVEQALSFLQQHQQSQPGLNEIARHCAMSETHFQRVFSHWAGVSPKRFLQCLTRDYCLQRLIEGDSILNSSVAAGLSSSSRLHDLMIGLEAVTPGEIKLAGEGLTFHCGVHDSPFGSYFIAATTRGIHRLEFLDTGEPGEVLQQLQLDWPRATIIPNSAESDHYASRLFQSPSFPTTDKRNTNRLTLWLRGSEFQFKVWEALLRIPEGKLCTYSSLATAVGQPSAARAVGSAVAKNPVAWLIPCHRVIKKMGATGEYRWGAARKQAILGREALGSEALGSEAPITDQERASEASA